MLVILKYIFFIRGARFCICWCENPPTEEQSTPPEFLGNIHKMHATVVPGKVDIWEFTNKESMDADKSCFVKCSVDSATARDVNHPTGDIGKGKAAMSEKAIAAPVDQLYLFLELTSTIKLRDKGNGREAIDRIIKKRYMKSARDLQQLDKASGSSWFNKSSTESTARSNKPKRMGVSRSRSRSRGFEDSDDGDEGEPVLSTDPKRARSAWFGRSENANRSESPGKSKRELGRSKSKRGSAFSDEEKDDSSNLDTTDPRKARAVFFGKSDTKGVNNGKASREKSMKMNDSIAKRNTEADAAAVKAMEDAALLKALIESADQTDDADLPTVEMCSGWVMIPLASTLKTAAGSSTKLTLKLTGGTPFTLMDIKNSDIPNRSGMWAAMKRALGIPIASELQLLLSPLTKPRGPEGPLQEKLLTHLSPNVIVPTNGVIAVALCRTLLIANQIERYQGRARNILPQTGGALLRADPVFSALPRILSDPAACRVFFLLWSIDGTKEISTRPNESSGCSIEPINVRAVDSFNNVVLRLWRAFSAPDAQPDRLVDEETVDSVYRRELRIRELAGIPLPTPFQGTLKPSTSSSQLSETQKGSTLIGALKDDGKPPVSTQNTAGRIAAPVAAPVDVELTRSHTPFSTRELLVGDGALL